MLQLCFDTSYQTLEMQNNKNVALNTVELLSSDEDALITFLFSEQNSQLTKNDSEISQNLEEQGSNSIVSDAEILFNDESIHTNWKKEPDTFDKYQLIKITLSILKNPQKNQTCLGYLNKIYSALLRRQSKRFLQFLSLNQEYLQYMIKGIQYYAIGNLLMVALSSEDKTGQYEYEQFKKQVFQQIIKRLLSEINHPQIFQGILLMIEELLNISKNTYYQYFDDFKRCAQILVCQNTLKIFYQFLNNQQEAAFGNALLYLELVLKRINNENEENQNDFYRQNQNTPSLKFEHQFLFNQLNNLINFCNRNEPSYIKITLISLIIELLKNKDFPAQNIDIFSMFKKFLGLMVNEKSKGMVKNYYYQLVHLTILKFKESEILSVLEWVHHDSSEQIKSQVDKINPKQEHFRLNFNESGCFMKKVLYSLGKKCQNLSQGLNPSEIMKIKNICEKYDIKLAKEEQNIEKLLNENEFKLQLSVETLKKKKIQENTVGKNKVSIPTLNLPINQVKIVVEEEQVEKVQISNILNRQSLINDLKNTKIELPEKFKKKEKKEADKENQPHEENLQFFTRHLILF